MSLADDEEWILPENLKRHEKKVIGQIEAGADERELGDFGAYHGLLTGHDPEAVKAHAITDERYLASYVRQTRALVGTPRSLLDVGCGSGQLTRCLAAGFPGCDVAGIDISESGIEYARKAHPGCRFEVRAVSEATDLGRTFDVVHAREFYPFTRTGDLSFQAGYVKALARHVGAGGTLLLTLLSRPKTLAANADLLAPTLEALGMTPFRRVTVANARIPAGVPLPAARAATSLVLGLAGRDAVRFYLSTRRVSEA